MSNQAPQVLTPAGIESTFMAHYAGLYRYAYTLLKEREAARDAVQQLFTGIWAKRDEIRIAVSLEAYLYRALYNYCMNRRNRDMQYVALGAVLSNDTVPAADLALECRELQAEIDRAIDTLPPQCREVFLKSRMEGKSYSAIAAEQGISVKTVEAQITKALRIIRGRLEHILIFAAIVVWMGSLVTAKFCLWQQLP